MPVRSPAEPRSSSRRPAPSPAVPPPCQSPDLFGHLPAASTPSSARKPKAEAEWPAAGSPPPSGPPPPRRTAAADRPSRSGRSLSGPYDRVGSRLRRADGLTLTVCHSHRGRRSHGDSERYVTVATPGGGKPTYLGNLYADRAGLADDLDGCQFQDGQTRTRYALTTAGTNRYAVAAVPRHRRGRVSE